MRYDIVTMGAPLVEMMRKELDRPFCEPADLSGPYPSGDTPIFIGAAARLGAACCFIGVVGEDDFGRCVVNRLRADGVDVSCVRVAPGRTTAVTFVSYFSDGSRKFIYHCTHAAAGLLGPGDIDPERFRDIGWLHVTGFALAGSPSAERAVHKALGLISDRVRVSFDPNIRPEILSVEQIRRLCAPVLERACLVLPSAGEAAMLTGEPDDERGCRRLQEGGKLVARKNGSRGCTLYGEEGRVEVPGFPVREIDPTGAGDCFAAAFITGLNEGMSPGEAARFANAVGAMSVRARGPMEGAPWRREVEEFMLRHAGAAER
ncbi:MAG: sugar kinase [Spirochaetota bacterium]